MPRKTLRSVRMACSRGEGERAARTVRDWWEAQRATSWARSRREAQKLARGTESRAVRLAWRDGSHKARTERDRSEWRRPALRARDRWQHGPSALSARSRREARRPVRRERSRCEVQRTMRGACSRCESRRPARGARSLWEMLRQRWGRSDARSRCYGVVPHAAGAGGEVGDAEEERGGLARGFSCADAERDGVLRAVIGGQAENIAGFFECLLGDVRDGGEVIRCGEPGAAGAGGLDGGEAFIDVVARKPGGEGFDGGVVLRGDVGEGEGVVRRDRLEDRVGGGGVGVEGRSGHGGE